MVHSQKILEITGIGPVLDGGDKIANNVAEKAEVFNQ